MDQDRNRKGNFRSGGGFKGSNRTQRFGGKSNGNFRRNNFSRKPAEMHKTKCDECKKDCEVPFKPTPGKAVFCKECYRKKKGF